MRRRKTAMTTVNIEKKNLFDGSKLSGEYYFSSILQEAYDKGLLSDEDIENIQLQCIRLLANKSERYNDGKSSSIRVEAAESIMKSILYTIGLYLKSLPDFDCAVSELKTSVISEMYEKGRKLINIKLNTSRHIYRLAQKNRLETINYTYNATLNDSGIGVFFEAYNPDYEAHEMPASIDYQLCNPVMDLVGVEFIQKYLENLYLENEFCRHFTSEDIHHLLCGYDEGYKDLLINIFEHVLTEALGSSLANLSITKLDISEEEVRYLYSQLSMYDDNSIVLKINSAAEKVIGELDIDNPSLLNYIEKSLTKITSNIIHAVRTSTLKKIFIAPVNPDLKPKIQFSSSARMDDKEYREFIYELMTCRYSSDKLAFIKEKVKSFGDIEDILLDAGLSEEEITLVLDTLGDVEIAALLKRHPFKPDVQAMELSGEELALRLYINNYMDRLAGERRKQVFGILNQLVDEQSAC
jgi:hypothetical protein